MQNRQCAALQHRHSLCRGVLQLYSVLLPSTLRLQQPKTHAQSAAQSRQVVVRSCQPTQSNTSHAAGMLVHGSHHQLYTCAPKHTLAAFTAGSQTPSPNYPPELLLTTHMVARPQSRNPNCRRVFMCCQLFVCWWAHCSEMDEHLQCNKSNHARMCNNSSTDFKTQCCV